MNNMLKVKYFNGQPYEVVEQLEVFIGTCSDSFVAIKMGVYEDVNEVWIILITKQ